MIKEELQKEGFMDSLKGAFGMGKEEEPEKPEIEPNEYPPMAKAPETKPFKAGTGTEITVRNEYANAALIQGTRNDKPFSIEVDTRQSYGMAAMNPKEDKNSFHSPNPYNPSNIDRLIDASIAKGGKTVSYMDISENKQRNKTMTKKHSSDDKLQKLFEGFRSFINENEETDPRFTEDPSVMLDPEIDQKIEMALANKEPSGGVIEGERVDFQMPRGAITDEEIAEWNAQGNAERLVAHPQDKDIILVIV